MNKACKKFLKIRIRSFKIGEQESTEIYLKYSLGHFLLKRIQIVDEFRGFDLNSHFDPGAPVSTPSFGSHLNPIPTRGGADYAHHILKSPPSFESHRNACDWFEDGTTYIV